ncbi:MAG: PhnD/SsuA/transferrin family substrate-binding protein, partial [Sandaracinaceae bacterium]|nr:PhnD/SsuA/transferrin family substrate-binding protein [Sandaracinaceae bacterium]
MDPAVLGKYRIEREIGRSEGAIVYDAVHAWTQRPVVVKLLAQSASSSALAEIRAAGKLVHSNAATVIDADTSTEGRVFVVEERLSGQTLRDRLERGVLSIDEAADALLPIMDALAAAHSADIVHRDVRPSNVFLARVGERVVPKLVDFGITTAVRTDALAAPELRRGEASIDGRVDVWSIGATWLVAVAGPDAIERCGQDDPEERARAIASSVPSAPSALVAVLARALAPHRLHRWPTVHEMRRAMALALGRPSSDLDLPDPISVELSLGSLPPGSLPPGSLPPGSLPPGALSPGALPPGALAPSKPPSLAGVHELARTPHAIDGLLSHGLVALRFGVVPVAASFHDPTIGDTLAQVLGAPVVVVRFDGYDELFAALRAQRVEVAWMAPAPFVRAAAEGLVRGKLASVRGGTSTYVSVLLGHAKRVHALELRFARKRRAAWVDRWSAAGYLVPRRVLRGRGIEPDRDLREQAFVGSYPAVVDSLRTGAADLGGVFGWRREDGSVWHLGSDHDELLALAVSEPIPSDVMAFHARLG